MYQLRKPCRKCSGSDGRIETKNGQDCVYCVCGTYQYNAPKTETGRAVRTVATVHAAIGSKKRAAILMRANGGCELCGKRGCNLHVGHLISVDHGIKSGLTDEQINDPENLCSLCDECNLGIGSEVIPLRFAVALFMARLRNRGITNHDPGVPDVSVVVENGHEDDVSEERV